MAGRKGFEPSVFSVTGRRVNQATPPTHMNGGTTGRSYQVGFGLARTPSLFAILASRKLFLTLRRVR